MGVSKLTKKDVLHVAKLSGLTLTESEIKKFSLQLTKIIGYVSELSGVNTENVDSVDQPLGLFNVFREDCIDTSRMMTPDKALSGTDSVSNNFFIVPKVLKNRRDQ